MFISHTYKLIFFEVPRTGSRSISSCLARLDPRSPTAVVRAVKRNLYQYHVYDQSLIEKHPDYALIAVHRNPYDRLRSHFKYRKQHGNPDQFKEFSFEQYVMWVCTGTTGLLDQYAMLDKPITELVRVDDVDHWLRFDSLTRDWGALAESLAIKLPELPSINGSKPMYNQESTYSESLSGMVYKRFESDFEQFGYAKNSWV